MGSEFSIIILVALTFLAAYTLIYPKIAGHSFERVTYCDIFVTGFIFLAVAQKYWGSGVLFSFLGLQMNWFWFTLLVSGVIEVPLLMWYYQKYLKPSEES
ncbi:hypothetical protein KO489_07170 [Reinekea forsetii]|nr:hypothetical protein [Reinekea forsetii]